MSKIVGTGRVLTREFLRLQSHFLFEEHFCRVRRGNEKGHVETHVGYARRNLLVPVPSFDSFAALNEYLAACCYADLFRRVRGKPETKAVLVEADRAAMLGARRTLRGAQGGARSCELAFTRALRPKRLLGADRLRPSRRHLCRWDRGAPHPLRHRRGGHPPALGTKRECSSTSATTWRFWSESPGRSTSPGP